MFNPDKFTNICCRYGITPNQLYVLYLVYIKDTKNMYKYVNEVGLFDIENDLEPLVDKGYLLNFSNIKIGKGDYLVDQLHVTDAFCRMIFIDAEEAGEQLFETYPQWLIINNQRIVAKSCDKDRYKQLYTKKINNDLIKHERIIDSLKRAKEKGLINVAIKNFIDGELWEAFIEIDNEIGGSEMTENV